MEKSCSGRNSSPAHDRGTDRNRRASDDPQETCRDRQTLWVGSRDTPLGLKPSGFCPHGFSLPREDSIPFDSGASYAGWNYFHIRGRCHHLQLLGGSKFTQILCVR
jgi:hypothetical protein